MKNNVYIILRSKQRQAMKTGWGKDENEKIQEKSEKSLEIMYNPSCQHLWDFLGCS